MTDFKFDIVSELGVLSEGSRGWQKEVNIIRWNDRSPKLDIRDWGPDHGRMGKGLTFNREELIKLREILNQLDIEGEGIL